MFVLKINMCIASDEEKEMVKDIKGGASCFAFWGSEYAVTKWEETGSERGVFFEIQAYRFGARCIF